MFIVLSEFYPPLTGLFCKSRESEIQTSNEILYFHRFGPVYLGEVFSGNEPPKLVIIKISRRTELDKYLDHATENPLREIAAMQFLHPNVPPTYPLQYTMHQIECCVTRDDQDVYSMMPYCTLGDLADLIINNGAMNASGARNMMHQLLEGLQILQHHGVHTFIQIIYITQISNSINLRNVCRHQPPRHLP